ncbi:MAG: hypothetical protein IJI46_11025 [Erysipelotrichaceae bacterium]|nr:hypothetical protein [Erysipelotrichaceae bacterium]
MFNIKTLVLIRDILMYIGMFVGIFMIGYVRVSFSNRQKKSPHVALTYNEKELKLRKIAIVILVITVALALIPTRNIQ